MIHANKQRLRRRLQAAGLRLQEWSGFRTLRVPGAGYRPGERRADRYKEGIAGTGHSCRFGIAENVTPCRFYGLRQVLAAGFAPGRSTMYGCRP